MNDNYRKVLLLEIVPLVHVWTSFRMSKFQMYMFTPFGSLQNVKGENSAYITKAWTYACVTRSRFASLHSNTKMKHGLAFRKFSRTSSHRNLMLRYILKDIDTHNLLMLMSGIWWHPYLNTNKLKPHFLKQKMLLDWRRRFFSYRT